MRHVFTILALLLLAGVCAPQVAQAATSQEQAIILKKKKAAEAKRAAEKKKKAERRRECGSFLECLFGKPRPRGQVRNASLSSSGRQVADQATAEDISWNEATKYKPGSIVVSTPERALYLVTGNGTARRYKVGVGREGFQWSGNSRIVSKQEWPTWRPPARMIAREAAKGHFLPEEMAGGPENPLGARALYIGGTLFRIHGTNNAGSIGGAVSSGCIRMMNTDVVDLYDRVKVGAKVYVYQ
ncbi:MAG: L,D-transpeptidase [Alphaproteobacteria bacterium]|nr:L,D-transpeptidase [Alphaproteobacteria bacterium]